MNASGKKSEIRLGSEAVCLRYKEIEKIPGERDAGSVLFSEFEVMVSDGSENP